MIDIKKSNYKLKYIKYKMKYLILKSGFKIFKTEKNNGSDGSVQYSNQCLWLSILSYLTNVMGNDSNLTELRHLASGNGASINGKYEEFDFHKHEQALRNVIESYDLQIHFYRSFKNENKGVGKRQSQLIIGNEPLIYGNIESTNIVSIVSYGNHFELITEIGLRKLYRGLYDNIGNVDKIGDFVPKRDLIIGKKSSKIDKLTKIQLSKIDELFEINNNLEKIVGDTQMQINLIDSQLIDLEVIISTKHDEYLEEDEQECIFVSYQEHTDKLSKLKKEFENELTEMTNEKNKVQKEINQLIE